MQVAPAFLAVSRPEYGGKINVTTPLHLKDLSAADGELWDKVGKKPLSDESSTHAITIEFVT